MWHLVKATAQSFDPLKRNNLPTPQEAGWAEGIFGRVRKDLNPWCFDPRTVHVPECRYISLVLKLIMTATKTALPSVCS